jgi:hypothetical protein
MPQLTGMAATLTTAGDDEAGTNDHIYIGAFGTGGGREFPLASPDEDFETGVQKFALGDIWEGGVITSTTSFPNRSKPGEDNDPALVPVDVDRVSFVYLRKQGGIKEDDDDAYKLQEARVVLYGPAQPSKRVFLFSIGNNRSAWMGNEHGLVIYLQEERKPT